MSVRSEGRTGTEGPDEEVIAEEIGPEPLGSTMWSRLQQSGLQNGLPPEQEAAVLAHLSIVRSIAKQIYGRLPAHVALEDLLSAGTIGLLDAVKRFNPKKRVLFRTYAQFRIRGAILDNLRSIDWAPRHLRRRSREVAVTTMELRNRLGRIPTENEIADALQMDLVSYQNLIKEIDDLAIVGLDDDQGDEEDNSGGDRLASQSKDDPLENVLVGEVRSRLVAAIESLSEQERLVLTLYYYEEMTMKEIGAVLALAECSISRIHASALVHLRKVLCPQQIAPARTDKIRTRNTRGSAISC